MDPSIDSAIDRAICIYTNFVQAHRNHLRIKLPATDKSNPFGRSSRDILAIDVGRKCVRSGRIRDGRCLGRKGFLSARLTNSILPQGQMSQALLFLSPPSADMSPHQSDEPPEPVPVLLSAHRVLVKSGKVQQSTSSLFAPELTTR